MLIAKVYTIGWKTHMHTFPDGQLDTAKKFCEENLRSESSTVAIVFREEYFGSGQPKKVERVWQKDKNANG